MGIPWFDFSLFRIALLEVRLRTLRCVHTILCLDALNKYLCNVRCNSRGLCKSDAGSNPAAHGQQGRLDHSAKACSSTSADLAAIFRQRLPYPVKSTMEASRPPHCPGTCSDSLENTSRDGNETVRWVFLGRPASVFLVLLLLILLVVGDVSVRTHANAATTAQHGRRLVPCSPFITLPAPPLHLHRQHPLHPIHIHSVAYPLQAITLATPDRKHHQTTHIHTAHMIRRQP
jgi:hypothetical protein